MTAGTFIQLPDTSDDENTRTSVSSSERKVKSTGKGKFHPLPRKKPRTN